jgi:putative ABC transport system permease protein
LREAGRGAKGTIRHRLTRDALVVGEIGLAIVLLVGTGLLIKTLYNLRNDRLGFDANRVLTVQLCCPDNARYPTPREVGKFYQQLFERLPSVPEAESVAMISFLPQRQFDGAGSVIQIKGTPPPEPGKESIADPRFISPNFFETMRIPMRSGRALTLQDDMDHPLVAVINESMARKYFPDRDPIGQQMQMVNLQPLGRWFTIVGVAADSRDRGLGRETRSTFYLSYLQNQIRGGTLLVRAKPGAQSVVGQIKDLVRTLNQDVTVAEPRTLEDRMAESLSPERFSATLLTLFALIALTLASVGVYGVVSYSALQRTHEIGVRMALGAQRKDVLKLVLGHGAKLSVVGVVLGLIGSLLVSRLLNTLLFGVSARDPLTLAAVSVLLGGVAMLACYIPARRAMKVDPLEALRYE